MKKEGTVSADAQYMVAQLDGLPMRNNVGVTFDAEGRAIRYGLLNESKRVNDQYKSSDLICILPVKIQQYHVGRVMGLFAALETKRHGWTLKPSDAHAQAQLRFHNLVRQYGGLAGFITDPEQVKGLFQLWR